MFRNRESILRVIRVIFIVLLLLCTTSLVFAWFRSGVSVSGGEAKAAKVRLNLDPNSYNGYYDANGDYVADLDSPKRTMACNMYVSSSGYTNYQKLLEGASKPLLPAHTNKNGDNADYYNLRSEMSDEDYNEVQAKFNDIMYYVWKTANGATDNYLVKSPWLVQPGDTLLVQYAFVNESTVPAYFRIRKPKLAVMDGAVESEEIRMHSLFTGWVTDTGSVQEQQLWKFNPATDDLLVGGDVDNGYNVDDQYLYLSKPLEPGREFTVTFAAYIPGGVNWNYLQSKSLAFVVTEAELIQATNNALRFDEAWDETWSLIRGKKSPVVDSSSYQLSYSEELEFHYVPYTPVS